eukprot:TRINITY_DN322_c0_g1_i4.p1 TRINITY_DN322_c0_g1~~TRINITY_DN322_c0_g1_i4.p1  ORF type:complete len:1246 (-),score=423.44 TRINITY_DN322_c0_g1_i4:17-3754(-)
MAESSTSKVYKDYSFQETAVDIDQLERSDAEATQKTSCFGKKKEEKKEEKVSLRQLWRYATKFDVFLMVIGAIGAALHGGLLPLFTIVMGDIMDSFNTGPDAILDLISGYALYFVYLGIAAFVFTFAQNALYGHSSNRQINVIREKYFEAIVRQEVGWFDKQDSGALTARIAGDTVLIQGALGEKFAQALQLYATFLTGIIIGFVKSWKLTLVILAMSPLMAAAGAFMVKLISSLATKGQKAYAEAGGVATEMISSIRTVQSFAHEEQAVAKYQEKLEMARKLGIRRSFFSGFGMGTTMLILFGSFGLALWYGGQLVISKEITGGTVITVFFAILMGSFSLGQAGPAIEALGKGQGAAYVIYTTIDRVSKIDPLSEEGLKLDDVQGNIVLKNLQFKYPTRPDVKIMRKFNLEIKSGQKVALVGSSGSGKSSTVSLIQRFYDPESGNITIDGTDLTSLNLKWWRQQIGLVSQEPVLFTGSIADNIRYGKEDATDEEVEQAARSANAHNFISSFPEQYATQVGEKGAQLSGGQKQRIAIARAIIKSPKILLLDEATSALDTESEQVVQEALESAMKGRTTIVIAHRLSTIRDADQIAVIQKGKVVELGNHTELMERQKKYYKLVMTQEGGKTLSTKSKKEKKENSEKKEAVLIAKKVDGEEEKEKAKSVSLWRLLKMNKPEWGYLFLGCLCLVFVGALNPIFAIVFSEMINLFYKPADVIQVESVWWALGFVGLGLIPFIFQTSGETCLGVAGESLTARVRVMTFKSIIRNDIAWFDRSENSTGILTSRLSQEATMLEQLVGRTLGLLFQNLVTITAGLVIAFIYGWKLTLVILACSPLLAIANFMQMLVFKGVTGQTNKENEGANQIAIESIGNIRTVAAFTREEKLIVEYKKRLNLPRALAIRTSYTTGAILGFSEFCMYAINALGFWYGAKLVRDGEMSFVDVLKVFNAILLSAQSVGQSASVAPNAGKARAAAAVIFGLIDHVPEFSYFNLNGDKPDTIEATVDFHDVKFAYATRQEAPILRGLTLSMEPGKVLALVGQSGCGKSSIISLIERFYDASSGEIRIGGHSIKDLNLRWLRENVGLVGQEPVLFSGTIADNIKWGLKDATPSQIEEAAKMANAHNFILEFPEQYATQVGEKGAQLSGGQKQRIAIARAIIKSPKILLLDEATSALDTESEQVVQEALESAMKGRTTIVIAHRLSTIRDADQIAVIQDGIVVEKGTHSELLANEGPYYNLVQKQVSL